MTSKDGTAEIYDMEDARARRRASELPGAEYGDAGAHLAAVREASGLSIEEAAAKTHIKAHHLEAIEALDLGSLPPRPYAIGFVKVYGEFLGLDAAALVDRFKQDMGFSAPPKVEVEKFEVAEAAAEANSGELSLIAVIAIIVFFIWCAWQITLLDGRELSGAGLPVSASEPGGEAILDPQSPGGDAALAEIVEARIVERVEPVFPRSCLGDAKAVETVMVAFNITAGGRVAGERVASSSNPCFDASALNAVRRWRFEPRTVDGAPRALYDQQARFSFERPR